MSSTVNSAFRYLMNEIVNLDEDETQEAKTSRDYLIANIHDLGSKEDFFNLYNNVDIAYGSFARKTKKRPLDDIDIMIGINADSSKYQDSSGKVEIFVENLNSPLYYCTNDNGNILNSTRVKNLFKNELEKIPNYCKADLHSKGEAVTLNLLSYDWIFDIVPCFMTTPESDGRTFYLIPDGKGNWKKTDPRKDRDRLREIDRKHSGRVVDTIRLVKNWNSRETMPSMPSYLLECMLSYYFESIAQAPEHIKARFVNALYYIKSNVFTSVQDPKGIEGDINTLSIEVKNKISAIADRDNKKAYRAYQLETVENDQKSAMRLWKEIFGDEFPDYEE
jgi:hypothetical protein